MHAWNLLQELTYDAHLLEKQPCFLFPISLLETRREASHPARGWVAVGEQLLRNCSFILQIKQCCMDKLLSLAEPADPYPNNVLGCRCGSHWKRCPSHDLQKPSLWSSCSDCSPHSPRGHRWTASYQWQLAARPATASMQTTGRMIFGQYVTGKQLSVCCVGRFCWTC